MPTDRYDDAAWVWVQSQRPIYGGDPIRIAAKSLAALLREEVGKERANFRDFCRGLFSHEPRKWGVVLSSLQAAFPLKGEAPDGD